MLYIINSVYYILRIGNYTSIISKSADKFTNKIVLCVLYIKYAWLIIVNMQ